MVGVVWGDEGCVVWWGLCGVVDVGWGDGVVWCGEGFVEQGGLRGGGGTSGSPSTAEVKPPSPTCAAACLACTTLRHV